MMIKYKLDDNKIFVVTFEGEISLDDIISYLKEVDTLDYLPDDIKLLYNLKKADFKILTDEIRTIAEFSNKVTHKFKSIKTAFYVTDPLLTAYSYLFSGMDKNSNRQRLVFSTENIAIKWLLKNE